MGSVNSYLRYLFRSTLLHEERRTAQRAVVRYAIDRFDPRSCTRSDDAWTEIADEPRRFRSTLLHEERRQKPEAGARDVVVSIHAPARGAT